MRCHAFGFETVVEVSSAGVFGSGGFYKDGAPTVLEGLLLSASKRLTCRFEERHPNFWEILRRPNRRGNDRRRTKDRDVS